jgi:hypothetical protein
MLFDAPDTQLRIAQLVNSVTYDANLREELIQEALLHFWRKESRLPEQTLSYYLQSCRYFLLVYLRRGRSLDSRRKAHLRADFPDEDGVRTRCLLNSRWMSP